MTVQSPKHREPRRIEGLDVLRGLAIGLVMLHHAWTDVFGSAGIVGVLIFFTLSGYLITSILMGDLERGGKIRYGRFYRNRALRLLPALYAMLAVLALVTLTINPRDERGTLVAGLVVAVFYVANLVDTGFFSITHLWTLATEEQFYLAWPLVLSIGVRLRILRWLVAGTAVVIMLGVFVTLGAARAPGLIYPLPTSWAIALVIGASAQLNQARIARRLPSVSTHAGRVVLGTAFAAILGLSVLPLPDNWPISYYLGGPLVAVLSVLLIFGAREWRTIPSQSLAPVLWLGTVSYAAYLWNLPIALWAGTDHNHTTAPVISLVATLAAAALSWWLIERPIAQWRGRRDDREAELRAVSARA
ncbi:peptidoglycan/LPS O-acetylase OafA/YrhL [Marmoricola sp. URHA0025 HA25]